MALSIRGIFRQRFILLMALAILSCALRSTRHRLRRSGSLHVLSSSKGPHAQTVARAALESNAANTQRNVSSSSSSSSSSSYAHSSQQGVSEHTPSLSAVREAYKTLMVSNLCGANCYVVRSPSPEELVFEETSDGSYRVDRDDLHNEEVIFGRRKERNNRSRVNKFLGGRIALRRAINALSPASSKMHGDDSMLTNQYGAPVLPPGITGSISHKDDLAVGVASLDSAGRVGVDLERCSNKAAATLARRILSEGEGCSLGVLEGVDIEEDVLLRFSFKEAVYKALHAYLPRAIDFSEVEVFPKADGSAELRFLLKGGEQFPYEASWQRYLDRYWLTCVYLQPPDSGGAGTDIS